MKKKSWICLLAGLLVVSVSSQAFASPDFAYSEERWAQLRDDRLEFEEIGDLVHEYNNTVIQNRIAYQDEKDKDHDDIAQEYYDRANDIYSNIEYPDSDDSNYGSRMASALNSELQADQLMERGDESTDDSETLKLGYDQTQASLVKQAQGLMITYWNQYYSLEALEDRKQQARQSLESEQTRLAAGMSTQAKLLSAQEAVTSAEASILSSESSLAQTKENLCLMLGWTYGAQVEMGELPEPDLAAIDAISLEADIQKALENNYTYKKTTKQLANARTASVHDTLEQTQKKQRETISNSVADSYSSLLLARSSYEQALQAFQIQQTAYESAGRKLEAGIITQKDYQTQQSSYQAAEVTVRTRKLALLQAMVDYQWNVDGLASAS